jgi:hypothetical protein
MAKKHHKNPKARKDAAKALLAKAIKRKGMMSGSLQGDGKGTADAMKVPRDAQSPDSGNPGSEMT